MLDVNYKLLSVVAALGVAAAARVQAGEPGSPPLAPVIAALEPAAWAVMIVGLGVGALLRRRRQAPKTAIEPAKRDRER
jgi:hypothetical protein